MKRKSKTNQVVYLCLAFAMLLIALPKIEFTNEWTLATLFGAVWVGFTLVVIGAQLHFLLGVNEEKRERLRQIRQQKIAGWQRALERKMGK
ncbi:hypothetical protein [Paenibacillus sp. CECT 9249]|uniref:hypothetical protein n=1 Tax=unclassified Paenibacillus TaxID=185978 RepID=UPI001E48B904|nr:hypothetical protein [Paenibacillus sp. CECT 9249]CAH0117758.1 hypothetical protein PAE9249_00219 [Paenibacillus sp. CECT 9249]